MTNPTNHRIRIVTAASLFDGHDAAINIMRRLLQSRGAEIIHLGHNRSAHEIVECAIEEDAHAVAITSYQGGHVEFFKYIKDLLDEAGCGHINVFGGGGGTILPDEINTLHSYGISRIYSPEDGRTMGLEGMIDDLLERCKDSDKLNNYWFAKSKWNGQLPLGEAMDTRRIARAITESESDLYIAADVAKDPDSNSSVIGITGTGGAGKSSVTDELVRRFLAYSNELTVAVISVDPSRKKSGGALLGDRIRMNAISHPRVYMRSLATRGDNIALSPHVRDAINICKNAGYDIIILESAGVGQSDTSILEYCETSVYVMTPEYGAASQLEKINMLDYADIIVLNKADKAGALDALHDIKKQYKRNMGRFAAKDDDLPVVSTIAAQFNNEGMNRLFQLLCSRIQLPQIISDPLPTLFTPSIIPQKRSGYLSEIAETNRAYDNWVNKQCELASLWYRLAGACEYLGNNSPAAINEALDTTTQNLDSDCKNLVERWSQLKEKYLGEFLEYQVRGTTIRNALRTTTLSGTSIQKILLPQYNDWGDRLRWMLQENVPGQFPFTAGVFELKRADEEPIRMFAGEGGPARTNKRFHYLSRGQQAIRLSTAFDSVTLYGEDPNERPDVFGKIGNSGVSIATLDDMKTLFEGFDLCAPNTSVSMTINGPAPMMLAFFLNAAIDQQLIKSGFDIDSIDNTDTLHQDARYSAIVKQTLASVRGTVQADILKEDQAQNTCIFSTEFALKIMGDVQEFFINNNVRNFYSVSISGYHIAEAGANPITQLAFTLANGFTYVEYYLARGMQLDDFAPNLSFFFSNGMDAEYSVLGRVARRIWAKAIKHLYKGNERSQKLKYHIQTSGRSLHAQEVDFNDIRTTLQALYAIYDNCNSLHTNAYDEAITTPTEDSVRRAMAIQLIINRELGTTKNENPNQGSFLIEELTQLVEEAVLKEFDRISQRGGVLGAMERMYQRNRIQEESMLYENMKHSGELPVIGVNAFLRPNKTLDTEPGEVIRSTEQERFEQIKRLQRFKQRHEQRSRNELEQLKKAAVSNSNIFQQLMRASRYCSLGQMTHALYEVGGQYRRNM